MIHTSIVYTVVIGYEYDEKDLPNLSFLTQRKLKENLEGSLDFVRQTDSLDHDEVTLTWIQVK